MSERDARSGGNFHDIFQLSEPPTVYSILVVVYETPKAGLVEFNDVRVRECRQGCFAYDFVVALVAFDIGVYQAIGYTKSYLAVDVACCCLVWARGLSLLVAC
jgi:hypothetical protein